MRSSLFILAAVCLVGAVGAFANPIVSIGAYSVAQGSSRKISITVADAATPATEDIEGMTFTLQIDPGTGATPAITSVDLLTNTIWSAHVSPANVNESAGATNQFESFSLLTDNAGDYVNANGVLGTAVVSTLNAPLGAYTMRLIGTKDPASDSQFLNGVGNPVSAVFATGSLTVTSAPEPASLGLMGLGAITLLARRRRRI
jgi:hypothetical protein